MPTTNSPNLDAPRRPSPPVDAFFDEVLKSVHECRVRRQKEGIPGKSTFTICETAELTGQDVDEIRYSVLHGEISASNPTGMQWLIPRDEVLKLMPSKIDDCEV